MLPSRILVTILFDSILLSRDVLSSEQSSEETWKDQTCQPVTQDNNSKHKSSKHPSSSSCGNFSEFERLSIPEPVRVYKTKSGTGVHIFDDVFTLTSLLLLERFNMIAAKWRYREGNVRCFAPWTAPLNPNKIADTGFGRLLQQVVATVSEKTDMQLSHVELNIVRRQDANKVFFGSDTVGSEFSAVIYLNQIWRKDNYGDAIFYERDQNLALASIKPKYGRLLVFDSTIGFLPRPPSVGFRAGQLFLVAKFSTNQTHIAENQAMFEAEVKAKKKSTVELFSSMPLVENTQKNIGEHFVKQYKSANGKRILVFDNLFLEEDLKKIQHHVLNFGDFYYDDSFDFDSDNVVWIAAFSVDGFVRSRMWPIVQQVASFSSGKDTWFPYDISCNVIRSADHTRIHEDCEDHEEEWTFLLYLTPDWSPNYYGETAFFENTDDDSEVIATVLPKYGRVVIFEGIIPHSARPPISTFNETRLSFAVKLSITEEIGRRKMFLQSFDHELALHYVANTILEKHDLPEFETLYQRSLIEQIDEQREVDWRLAAYSFRGEKTDDSVREDNINKEDKGDEDDDDDDEDEEFEVVTEREDYIYSLLKKFADDSDKLKFHFQEFLDEYKSFEHEYAKKVLNIF
ncbi:uncharacterized protein LOC117123576 [Anneissia japonica]|uniref:uncharacterized protein LOC117123576 n=1 Tax=Anneissia japonica TaxID=1529436 RepID=UPI00142575EC|nr:uncharacterized protein LOC117123576 [Anneissia japonica]XP_033125448.1 uncharacterized protein LOC117123576 [Anneissia japonica]XP_033125450.1 uncharacterized protein LOC117123576 [Anneissia japonica]